MKRPPMSDTLPRDTDLHFPHLMVVSASAGSGKTTALTKRYVQFLLSDRVQHRRPDHLLAITFTNNAAAEMKQRILELLKRVALGEAETLKALAGLVDVDPSRLPQRAERVLHALLDDFAAFQVRTIDSFLVTVFRASAIELGYSPAVELQLHPERLIRQAFRTFALRVAGDEGDMELFRLLVDRADEGRSDRSRYVWNPFAKVTERVLDLHSQIASLGRPVRLPDVERDREHLTRKIVKAAATLRKQIETSSLPPYSHLMNDLQSIAEEDIRTVVGRSIKSKATNKPKTAAEKAAEASHGDAILKHMATLNGLLGEYALLDARSFYVPYAQTLKMMDTILAETKARENLVFLDDVNAALRTYMDQSIVPEVYIKLGERIHHFLIDEFQDTSPSQWDALVPLLENTLSEHGSLFIVGDMKQSIYSFRGADWRIMKRLIDDRVFPSALPDKRTLNVNYRSKPLLLDVTRDAFHERVKGTEFEGAAEATGLLSYHLDPDPKTTGGHAEVSHLVVDKESKEEFDRIISILWDAHARGNAWSDIAVLAPTNAAVIDLSSRLNSEGIPFVSQSSLDIRNRKVVGEMLACLRFLDAPVDDAAFATFALGDILSGAEPDLDRQAVRTCFLRRTEGKERTPLYKHFQETFPEIWDRRFEALFQHVGFLPLYDLVSAMIGTFDVFASFPEEEASVVRFLECVREFEAEGNNTVRDLVKEAEEESEGLSWELPRPSGQEAVTLMTIHKAKGLGFHVVVVLQYAWRQKGGRPALLPVEGGVELVRVGSAYERNEILTALKETALLEYRADELNKLYVALTRARSELYVLIVTDDPSKPPAQFLPEMTTADTRPEVDRPAGSPGSFIRARLVTDHNVRTEPQESELKDAEIRRGDLAHRLLAKLILISDTRAQLDKAISEAPEIPADVDPGSLVDALAAFLSLPDVRPLFEPVEGRTVWCEKEVADQNGRLYRIDRLIVDPDHVTIIDYKTGGREREEKYVKQVAEYAELCAGLYPGKPVHGIIAYIDKQQLVAVP